MKKLALTIVAASAIAQLLISCGDATTKTTETHDLGGKPTAWWIEVKVKANYPRGQFWFRQTNSEGKSLSGAEISLSADGTPNYTGAAKSYGVRVENRSNCDEPCGYIDAYICPEADSFCEYDKAAQKLEHVKVKGWVVELNEVKED